MPANISCKEKHENKQQRRVNVNVTLLWTVNAMLMFNFHLCMIILCNTMC